MGPQTNQNSPAITPVITPEPAGTVQNVAGPVVLEEPLKVVQETPNIEQNSTPNQAEIIDPHESLEAPTVTNTVATQTIDAMPTDASGAPNPTASTTPEVTPGATPPPKPPKKKFSLRDREANRLMFRIVGASLLSFILLVGAGYFVRRITNRVTSPASLVSEQDVDLGKKSATSSTLSLASSANTLVVNGNVLTKGSLQVGNGTAYGEISFSGTTSGQKYELPNASGTFCLSVNNCGFARNADIVTTSIAGASGVLTLGTGLALNGTVITNTTSQTEVNGATGAVTIQGTANQITVNTTNGVVTITTAQDIANTSSPTFSSITLTNVGTQNGFTLCDISNNCGYAGGGASFVQNGNSFGAAAVLGTNDNNSLAFETNGITRLTLDTNGSATLASGRLYVPTGSDSNPTYSFTGDTGLGMYRISASTLGFSTGGGEALRINGQGAVGIRSTTLGTNSALTLNTSSTVDDFAVAQFNTNSANLKALVVQGYTGQIANIQEWQNSAGTVLSSMSADGRLSVGTTSQVSRVTIAGDGTSAEGSALLVTSSVTNGNGSKGIKLNVKGGTGAPAFAYGLEIDTGTNSPSDIGSIRGINLTSPTRTSTGNITAQQAIYIENQYNATWNPNAYAIYQASSSDRSYFAGNIGIANATPGNRLSVRTPTTADATTSALIATGATGNKALVLQGVLGQTANLQEWQSSTGTVLASVSASGTGAFVALTQNGNNVCDASNNCSYAPASGSGNYIQNGTAIQTANFAIQSAAGGSISAVIRAAGGQTANLQEWQTSAAVPLVAVTSTGVIRVHSDASNYASLYSTGTGGLVITTATFGDISINPDSILYLGAGITGQIFMGRTTIDIPIALRGATTLSAMNPVSKVLTVRGAVSQSANLQEWQNSSGTALASINAGGELTIGSAASTSTTGAIRLGNAAAINWRNAAGSGNIAGLTVTSSDVVQLAAAVTTADTAATVSLGTTGTAKKGLVIQSVASQTANLQEWQNSVGTTLASVSSGGKFNAGNASGAAGLTSYDAYNLMINGSTYGAVKAFYAGSGSGGFGGMTLWAYQGGSMRENVRIGQDGYGTQVFAPTTATVALVAKGASGQTANLQEWQSSVGTALLYVGTTGLIGSNATGLEHDLGSTPGLRVGAYLRIGSGGGGASSGSIRLFNNQAVNWRNAGNTANIGIAVNTSDTLQLGAAATTPDALADTTIGTSVTTRKGLVIQGVASQTANLQEWQNSTGTVLASISSAGNLSVVNATVTGTLLVTGAATFNNTLTVNGHIISGNTSGTTTIAVDTAGAGTGATASISGNDTSGVITINTGTGAAVGNLGTVTFANAYGSAPNVVITPKSIPGGGNFPQYHFDSGTTTFTLKAFNALTDSATYTFSYQIIQ